VPEIRIPPVLRAEAGGSRTVDVEGASVREALDALVEQLQTGSDQYRKKVAFALAQVAAAPGAGTAGEDAVRRLVENLASPGTRQAANEALLVAGKAAVPGLVASLEGRIPGDPKSAVALLEKAGDPRATDALTAELERGRVPLPDVLAALGATRDPVLGERARDFGLDKSVQVGELGYLYAAQMDEPENRAAMWQWLQSHYGAYQDRVPSFARGYMPRTFSEGRCSTGEADELSSFFAPRIKDLVGGERGLGQSLESIRQCASLRQHVGPAALGGWVETHESAAKR